MENTLTYVLVHGSGLGGWCWEHVKAKMEASGAKVYAPTIPASSHTLEDNIRFICDFIQINNLTNLVLVGHSYGGMVITGVADNLLKEVRKLIYLDAAVPKNGDDFASHVPNITKENSEKRRQAFTSLSKDGYWIQPISPELAGISKKQDVERVNARSRAFALQTWLEPIVLKNKEINEIDKVYILATSPPTDLMGYPKHGEIAKQSPDWTYYEIHCGHAAMIIRPNEIADILLK